MRVALGIEYDGSGFFGWQRQQNAPTVQEALEEALSKVANHSVRVTCAGRTDTGVHALEQVVHFDTESKRNSHHWVLGCNRYLPQTVSVKWAKEVPDTFNARFAAQSRHYQYWILNRTARSSLLSRRVTWVHRPLDAQKMHNAGLALVGQHDFSSYRALGCQAKTPVRVLYQLGVQRHNDLIRLHVHANAFLHHMVRNIAGVLIAIGQGDQPISWASEVLNYRDRTKGGVTARPDGLYLSRVEYPATWHLPQSSHCQASDLFIPHF